VAAGRQQAFGQVDGPVLSVALAPQHVACA
jgi:hypothetical protein